MPPKVLNSISPSSVSADKISISVPVDSAISVPKIMAKMKGVENATVIRDYDIEKLVVASDCVLSTTSTTGLEAMIIGKPVVCLRFIENKGLFVLPAESVFNAFKCNDLVKTIRDALKSPSIKREKQKQFLNNYLYSLDGKSTERISNLIRKIMNQID